MTNNIHQSRLWQKNFKNRLKNIEAYHYIPHLDTPLIKKTFFIVIIALTSFVFLTAASYFFLVIVVLNLRYYASQLIIKNQPFKITTYVLSPIAFHINPNGQSKYPDLGVVIPKIGVDAPIIPNVNPNDYHDYMAVLKKGVAMAEGSSRPGKPGNIYLFAHSTNLNPRWISYYNAVFYLLNKLQTGDKIFLWYKSKQYSYSVKRVFITSKDDKSFLYSNQNILILQTCYPPGTSLKRLIVIASPNYSSK